MKEATSRSGLMVFFGTLFGLLGWAILAKLLGQWPITDERDLRPYLFIALWLAVSGTSLPLIWVIHRRLSKRQYSKPEQMVFVIARQASFVGIWVSFCAWLQMQQVLNWVMASLVAILLILVEALWNSLSSD
ncbi:MAG: hypothetical protein ABFQ89_04535 [Chloroflexota bacterium]